MRICTACKRRKSPSKFPKASARGKLHAECKVCHAARMAKHKSDHPDIYRATLHRARLRKYGLTDKEFKLLIYFQNGMCGICGSYLGDKLHIDHDAISGLIRGLLCSRCNTAIGLLKHDRASCLAAAYYLKVYERRLKQWQSQ